MTDTNTPAAHLARIQQTASRLLTDSTADLTPQQQTFIQHIARTAEKTHQQIHTLPDHTIVLQEVLSVIGEPFEQSLVALYGYARMLLDSPASFGGTLPAFQQEALRQIYEDGVAVARLTDRLRKDAVTTRLDQRKQSPGIFDVAQLLRDQTVPLCEYWLRDLPVTFQVTIPQQLTPAYGHPYHLNALVQHIPLTAARELIAYGIIRLEATAITSDMIQVSIVVSGLQLTEDVLQTLFQKDGRHLYRQTLERIDNQLYTERLPGRGAAFHIRLPIHSHNPS